jgi:hypothetical protein
MDNDISLPASTDPSAEGPLARRPPQTPKLKDTCDMCSASKVRCSKEKPVCGRCEQLGYPCFYSPARRMGRPHPPRRPTAPSNKARVANGKASALSLENRSRNRHEKPKRHFATSSQDVEQSGRSTANVSNSAGFKEALGKDHADIGNRYHLEDHMVLDLPPPTRQKDRYEDDMATFGFGGLVDTCPDPISSQNIPYSSPPTLPLRSADPDTIDQMPIFFSGESDFHSTDTHSSESDCATLAIDMLYALDGKSPTKRPSSSTAGADGIEAAPLDDLVNTVSMAIKRVTSILVCPCSQKTDIGLLVAALCAAILDVYSMIFHHNKDGKNGLDPSSATVSHSDSGFQPSEEATVMHILVELPKVANLVMQFSRRYGGQFPMQNPNHIYRGGTGSQEEEWSAGMSVSLQAASLKSRTKAITDEATRWLAMV